MTTKHQNNGICPTRTRQAGSSARPRAASLTTDASRCNSPTRDPRSRLNPVNGEARPTYETINSLAKKRSAADAAKQRQHLAWTAVWMAAPMPTITPARRRLVNGLAGIILTVAPLLGPAAIAAGRGCSQYAFYRRLPDTFREIASGELSGLPRYEMFVLSNGVCTCENIFKRPGAPSKGSQFWTCRRATSEE
jgi:hypothetical protein